MSALSRTRAVKPADMLIGEGPRVLPWPTFESEMARSVKQGDHQLFVGPTQSGKTVLCRVSVRQRRFVIVWGTKKRDTSLDAYLEEGYTRIDQWPPRSKLEWTGKRWDRKPFPKWDVPDEDGNIHLILWPELKTRDDIRKNRDTYARTLDWAFIEGGWTIVIDETLWATRRNGLALDSDLATTAFQGASNKVTLYLCSQRPSGMERITWSSVTDAYIFKMGITDDIRELATLGTNQPRDVATVIRTQLGGHRFLHVPTRGQGMSWAISEVDPRVI